MGLSQSAVRRRAVSRYALKLDEKDRVIRQRIALGSDKPLPTSFDHETGIDDAKMPADKGVIDPARVPAV
jgi:hypothetical protein